MASIHSIFDYFVGHVRVLLVVGVFGAFLASLLRSPNAKRYPPRLKDTIPYVSNTIQYLTDAGRFMDRVTTTLEATKGNIVAFHVGLRTAYIVTGPKNVQRVFGSPHILNGNFLQLTLMDKHWGMTKEEIHKFASDRSGRLKTPAPGTENTREDQRYWLGHDHVYAEYLTNRTYSDALAQSFQKLFSQRLDRQTTAEWTTVGLFGLLKTAMAESAIISLFGSQIIDLNPGFLECYWEFDDVAGTLVWGLPNFMQRSSVRIKDRLHKMTRNHIDSAWENFDWDGADADSAWEPHFGSRLSRETAKWLREGGFSDQAAAGHTLASLFGLNGNTVPITAWAMYELIRDPSLLQAARNEVLQTYVTDPDTGTRHLDAQRLISMPLMQSFYVEIMRMHVSFNVTREAMEPIEIDGYHLEKGSLIQTCSQIAHFEEAVWGAEGHPASEFWAWRHVKYVEKTDEATGKVTTHPQFSMKGRPSSFFPYGGGYVMCPGRHFAKQEILLAIAVMITKFDIEFVEWKNLDGSRSDRPAQDDKRFAGFIAMSPDREMSIRLRKSR
ncbi:cytochrome P450 [Leptodontidium sp. MPI-SDFR-AT-0119]|nr:cytochrome P450 [Leptodontidium sp. MPI-SDFR-AT-0119]